MCCASPAMIAWVFAFVFILTQSKGQQPVVNTDRGQVMGSAVYGTTDAMVFKAIPYAAPPIGNLRFMKPQDAGSWGVLQANGSYAKSCAQPMMDASEMSEDCLYLNVYTPNVASSPPLPVMVWIHGGGFSKDSAGKYFSDEALIVNFVGRGVVIVSLNYRLSVFGLFTTFTSDFPANLAIWDQIKALQWVQSNIRNFGGDPQRVTVFGESSGGTAVSLLTYSPAAKGLFQQAIIQSNVALSPGQIGGIRTSYNPSKQLAISLGCITASEWDKKNFASMGDCLRSKAIPDLINAAMEVPEANGRQTWTPSADDTDNLLPRLPALLADTRSANMNVMLGSCKDEGSNAFLGCLLTNTCSMVNFTRTFPFENVISSIASEEIFGSNNGKIADLIRFFFGNGIETVANSNNTYWLNASLKVGDSYNTDHPIRLEAQYWTNIKAKTYLYSFDYVSSSYPWTSILPAVPHTADLYFLFNQNDPFGTGYWDRNALDRSVINLMGIMWTNFAKTGDPNRPINTGVPAWLPTSSSGEYFSIDAQNSGMRQSYRHMSYNFWGTLVPQILNPTSAARLCSWGSRPSTSTITMLMIVMCGLRLAAIPI